MATAPLTQQPCLVPANDSEFGAALVPFEFDGSTIRALTIDGDPWFIAKDVAELLGYVRSRDAVAQHCRGAVKRRLPTISGEQDVTVIPERDVYRLVMRSKLPAAERFEEWVVGEVLPAIRKTGSYAVAALPNFADPVAAARAWADAKEGEQRAAALAAERAILIEQQQPKVDFHDRYAVSTGNKGVREVAKLLRANERVFIAWLTREDGPMYRLAGALTPKAPHLDAGRFAVKAGTAEHGESSHAYNQAKFTPKGVTWIAGEWGKRTAALAAAA